MKSENLKHIGCWLMQSSLNKQSQYNVKAN